jgi:exosortase/archaeosortase family protein
MIVKQWVKRTVLLLSLGLVLNLVVLKPGNIIDQALTDFSGELSYRVAKALQFDVQIEKNAISTHNELGCKVFCGTNRWVYIGDDCNARNLLFLFVGFILTVPLVTIQRRMKFLLGGLLIIVIANVIRIVLLLLFASELPQILNLMHKYVFQVLMYILLFVLWNRFLKGLSETIDEAAN